MNSLMRMSVITSLAIIVSSCGTSVKKTVVASLALPPPIPQNMVLNQDELSCLSDATLTKVVVLDKRRKTLRNIIKATHPK